MRAIGLGGSAFDCHVENVHEMFASPNVHRRQLTLQCIFISNVSSRNFSFTYMG
jgi:hypothetical protein